MALSLAPSRLGRGDMSVLDTDTYKAFYTTFARRVALARKRLNRPLTYAEKIL